MSSSGLDRRDSWKELRSPAAFATLVAVLLVVIVVRYTGEREEQARLKPVPAISAVAQAPSEPPWAKVDLPVGAVFTSGQPQGIVVEYGGGSEKYTQISLSDFGNQEEFTKIDNGRWLYTPKPPKVSAPEDRVLFFVVWDSADHYARAWAKVKILPKTPS